VLRCLVDRDLVGRWHFHLQAASRTPPVQQTHIGHTRVRPETRTKGRRAFLRPLFSSGGTSSGNWTSRRETENNEEPPRECGAVMVDGMRAEPPRERGARSYCAPRFSFGNFVPTKIRISNRFHQTGLFPVKSAWASHCLIVLIMIDRLPSLAQASEACTSSFQWNFFPATNYQSRRRGGLHGLW
jgi:hypothetical protein